MWTPSTTASLHTDGLPPAVVELNETHSTRDRRRVRLMCPAEGGERSKTSRRRSVDMNESWFRGVAGAARYSLPHYHYAANLLCPTIHSYPPPDNATGSCYSSPYQFNSMEAWSNSIQKQFLWNILATCQQIVYDTPLIYFNQSSSF